MGRRQRQRQKLTAPTSDYRDPDGNLLTLRGSLTPGSRRDYAEVLAGGAHREDAWQRATELLFERLAVSWEIAGLPLTDQAMLIGRYRMADAETQAWVRRTIATHVERHIPELADLP